MAIGIAALIIGYIVLFFTAVVYGLKCQFGGDSKDERGHKFLNTSYGVAFT